MKIIAQIFAAAISVLVLLLIGRIAYFIRTLMIEGPDHFSDIDAGITLAGITLFTLLIKSIAQDDENPQIIDEE